MTMGLAVVYSFVVLIAFLGTVLIVTAVCGAAIADDDERCVAFISGVALWIVTCYIINWASGL